MIWKKEVELKYIFKLAFPTHSTDLRLCVCTVKMCLSGTVDCFRQVILLLCMN